jgi:hypothetical protein
MGKMIGCMVLCGVVEWDGKINDEYRVKKD